MVSSDMAAECQILWIAPNLNHYKKRFLNRLNDRRGLKITVFAGKDPKDKGHYNTSDKVLFELFSVPVSKSWFAFHPITFAIVLNILYKRRFHVVLMPVEKKYFPFILWLLFLRLLYRFRLVTYTHPVLRSRSTQITVYDLVMTRIVFRFFDRVVLYTRSAFDWAVARRLVTVEKSAYANNTVDTTTIWKYYTFEINRTRPLTLLFIGRLIPSKRLDLLLQYFRVLKGHFGDLRLIIIGDGPEAEMVQYAARTDENIRWCGAIVSEAEIASEMRKAHVVFVPGWSGLSVVHSFAYGKPYITCNQLHPPEISYLQDGVNGLLLSGDFDENITRIRSFLRDQDFYERACLAAFHTAEKLSVENWCVQMSHALTKWP